METINFSFNDWQELKETDLITSVAAESDIVRYNNCALKIFKIFNKEYLDNKLAKIKLINEKGKNNNWVFPEKIINIENKFAGYSMELLDNSFLCDIECNEIDMGIAILLSLKENLLQMHDNKIIHSDIYPRNISLKITDDNFISKFIDIDNAKVDDLSESIVSPHVLKYLENGGKVSYNSDIFMFNQLTFWYLTGSMRQYRNQTESLTGFAKYINHPFIFDKYYIYNLAYKNKKIMDYFKQLLNNEIDSTADHEFLIDHIVNITDYQKDHQIKRIVK